MGDIVSADWRELDGIIQLATEMPKEYEQAGLPEALRQLAIAFMSELQKRIPLDSGDYWESWHIGAIVGNTVTIETDKGDLYFILEWSGSLPHDIDAKPGGPKLKIPLPNGEIIFRWHVHHPGFAPIPHVGPALIALEARAGDIITKALGSNISLLRNFK